MDSDRFISYTIYIFLIVVSYLLLWPVPIDPVAWKPKPNPGLQGDFAPNSKLSGSEYFFTGKNSSPEDVAVDRQGRFYTGLSNGKIIRFSSDGKTSEEFASTDGRPMGLDFDARGNLVVADARRGLLRISPEAEIEILSDAFNGKSYGILNDVEVARDGTIYYSESSTEYSYDDIKLSLLELSPNGRLLSYNPQTGNVRVIISGLHFANGVAVSPDQSFVLVAETGRYRIKRHWLKGEKQGESEIFMENLPGFPGGISSNGDGIFWLTFTKLRIHYVDWHLLPTPSYRKLVARLPEFALMNIPSHEIAIGVDARGRVIYNFQNENNLQSVSNVQQSGDTLYFGSYYGDAIFRKKVF